MNYETPELMDQEETNSRVIKCCRDCKSTKKLVEFTKNKAFSSGYDTLCLTCNYKRVKAWREAGNRDSAKEARQYYNKNKGKCIAKSRAYQLRKTNAAPPWVNLKEIEIFYSNCPEGFHVDHIIPLKGKLVSGLHVPWNLQYLPAAINIKKGNRFYG